MTESGMSYLVGFASKSAGSALAPTRASARSPTTLELGVTLTKLPRILLAAAYMSSIDSNFTEAQRDRLLAQVRQLTAGDLVGVDPARG